MDWDNTDERCVSVGWLMAHWGMWWIPHTYSGKWLFLVCCLSSLTWACARVCSQSDMRIHVCVLTYEQEADWWTEKGSGLSGRVREEPDEAMTSARLCWLHIYPLLRWAHRLLSCLNMQNKQNPAKLTVKLFTANPHSLSNYRYHYHKWRYGRNIKLISLKWTKWLFLLKKTVWMLDHKVAEH